VQSWNKSRSASYVSCQRDTARICRWAPCSNRSIHAACLPVAQQQTRRCCDESMGQTDRPSAGLMPTEARGNYLPEAPYLRETKTYLNCNSRMQCMGTSNMHDYQHNTTMSVQFSSSLSQRPIFIYFFWRCYVKLLDYWRAEKIALLPEAPAWGLRPVAFATSATRLIRHWIDRFIDSASHRPTVRIAYYAGAIGLLAVA